MEIIVTGKGMKKVDTYTIDKIGIPSMVLMERAAYSMCLFVMERFNKDKRILCVCGTGNNGADGIALARQLVVAGYRADIVVIGEETKGTEEFITQKNIAIKCGVKIQNLSEVTKDERATYNEVWNNILSPYDLVVDAIFGVGLSRDIEGKYREVIDGINSVEDIKVLAADIPSGLDGDNGSVRGTAIKADYTVTFGAMKAGLLLYKGKDMSGEVTVADIGFPREAYLEVDKTREAFKCIAKEDINIPERQAHSNKGTYGKVLIVAGSRETYGAAYLSAMAAFRMGCGLVRIITHKNNRDLLYKMIPEAMIQVYDEEGLNTKEIDEAVIWADAVVIGSGISTTQVAEDILKAVMNVTRKSEKYLVIDADGLNIISENNELTELFHKKTVITPHIGEAARLFGCKALEVAENIVAKAYEYSDTYGINVVIKDCTTVILGIESFEDKCNNRAWINTSGNAGMATAGSGDILTGVIAAVLSGGIPVNEVIKDSGKIVLAVYIHGIAGDMAAKKKGKTAMVATDILNEISEIFMK